MIRFTNAIDIAAPVAHVYAYLADLEHTPEWNWAIAAAERIGAGPATVGARYVFHRTVPRPASETVEVTHLVPGRRIEVAGDLGPFAARLTYELTATPAGTHLVNAAELEPPVPLGPLGGVLANRVQASVRENLGVLKTILEEAGGIREPRNEPERIETAR